MSRYITCMSDITCWCMHGSHARCTNAQMHKCTNAHDTCMHCIHTRVHKKASSIWSVFVVTFTGAIASRHFVCCEVDATFVSTFLCAGDILVAQWHLRSTVSCRLKALDSQSICGEISGQETWNLCSLFLTTFVVCVFCWRFCFSVFIRFVRFLIYFRLVLTFELLIYSLVCLFVCVFCAASWLCVYVIAQIPPFHEHAMWFGWISCGEKSWLQ